MSEGVSSRDGLDMRAGPSGPVPCEHLLELGGHAPGRRGECLVGRAGWTMLAGRGRPAAVTARSAGARGERLARAVALAGLAEAGDCTIPWSPRRTAARRPQRPRCVSSTVRRTVAGRRDPRAGSGRGADERVAQSDDIGWLARQRGHGARYDELKTEMLDREEAIRSKSPTAVTQELWGVFLAYNLVRLEMERVAEDAGVEPTRISFVAASRLICDEWLWCAVATPGAIPKAPAEPRRRTEDPHPAASSPRTSLSQSCKIKKSNYARKRRKGSK
jgi:hypothetical protein